MTPLRFGLIGAGQIAHVSAKDILEHEDAALVAAHDLNAPRLAKLCETFDIPSACDSVDALLANDQVDAVYIATPNKFHAPLAIQALNAGKHVILDKPFAMNLDEANAVAAAAKASSKLFTLGMNMRFREDSQKIKSLVDAGALGDLYHAKAYWMRRQGIPKIGTWFGNKELAGGGCLLDIGVHMLDLCLYTLNNFDPVSVSGATYTQFGQRGMGEGQWGQSDREGLAFDVDDFATALIKFRNGATVSLDVSWACYAQEASRNDVQLYGNQGGATLFPAKLFRTDPLRTDCDVIDNIKADIPMKHASRFHNFINAILEKEPLCCTLDQALTIQRILDAIYASAASGREVVIG